MQPDCFNPAARQCCWGPGAPPLSPQPPPWGPRSVRCPSRPCPGCVPAVSLLGEVPRPGEAVSTPCSEARGLSRAPWSQPCRPRAAHRAPGVPAGARAPHGGERREESTGGWLLVREGALLLFFSRPTFSCTSAQAFLIYYKHIYLWGSLSPRLHHQRASGDNLPVQGLYPTFPSRSAPNSPKRGLRPC